MSHYSTPAYFRAGLRQIIISHQQFMPQITIETRINAPLETCFDLARDIGLHCSTASRTKERAIAGITTGKINLGESVTFEAVHFGVRQKFTACVTEFDRPNHFVDEMTKGAFKSMQHRHEFKALGAQTSMTDTLIWVSPFGILGIVFDKILLEKHMRNFIIERNEKLKNVAERSF